MAWRRALPGLFGAPRLLPRPRMPPLPLSPLSPLSEPLPLPPPLPPLPPLPPRSSAQRMWSQSHDPAAQGKGMTTADDSRHSLQLSSAVQHRSKLAGTKGAPKRATRKPSMFAAESASFCLPRRLRPPKPNLESRAERFLLTCARSASQVPCCASHVETLCGCTHLHAPRCTC